MSEVAGNRQLLQGLAACDLQEGLAEGVVLERVCHRGGNLEDPQAGTRLWNLLLLLLLPLPLLLWLLALLWPLGLVHVHGACTSCS